MENIEKLISSAVEPLLARISSLQEANTKLRNQLGDLKRYYRPPVFSSSPKHSDRNREGKSKTLHLTDSGSNFKQVARGTRPQAATMQPVIEQPKQRTLTNTKSAAALKTVQNAKPIAGNTPVPVKKTVGKDKKHVKDNKETKESKEIKDNKENKTTGKAHHSSILPNKTTEPEPVIHAPEQQVDAVVDFVIPEIEVPKQSDQTSRSKKNVAFTQPTSFKYIEEGLVEKNYTGASQIQMLGLVSKQSLEPSLVSHHFGQGNQLSIQPEVASFLEQSYLKISDSIMNAALAN